MIVFAARALRLARQQTAEVVRVLASALHAPPRGRAVVFVFLPAKDR
jgi:hypothetical protein